MTDPVPFGHVGSPVRRRFLVALTVLVLWTVGYVAYAISSSVRATGPAEPPVRADAGEE